MAPWTTFAVALVSTVILSLTEANGFSQDKMKSNNQLNDGFKINPEPSSNVNDMNKTATDSKHQLRASNTKNIQAPSNCYWTECDTMLSEGQPICDKTQGGMSVGQISSSDCRFSTARRLCCTPTPNRPKMWSKSCYGANYKGINVCTKEFGLGYIPTGATRKCNAASTQYQCTN